MYRIGIGYDIHRLEAARPLILGGVEIPHTKGMVGHSDADALAHAITDALLGALALGDIGSHFPDNDPQFKGADSMKLLDATLKLVDGAGWRIVNVDTNVIAQQPKLRPHIDIIRQRLATEMNLLKSQVSVKAKTNESVGPEGREEAISTQAVVLLEQRNP
jgi:2-C-methyl-D-erythritol 2,4-cyclodiphosphate synthase